MEQQNLIHVKKLIMKNIKMKLILIFVIFFLSSCKSQQVYPLITSINSVPNGSYIKDIDNEYDDFVGIWKASFDNKNITLKISKEYKKYFTFNEIYYYQDILIIQHSITNSNGEILENYITSDIDNSKIISVLYSKKTNTAKFQYEGSKCRVGWGRIFLKKQNSIQLLWNYFPQPIVLTNINCPDAYQTDIKINLPHEQKDLIFTKQ